MQIRLYQRQRILLALIEAFAGRLGRTDCQKLVFLFCQTRGKQYYDFFPHRFGGFSYMVSRDAEWLAAQGILTGDRFLDLSASESFLGQLEPDDTASIRAIQLQYGGMRGKTLIRQVYLAFPWFASRSEIVREVLSPEEISSIEHCWRVDDSAGLFTIGYEGLTIDAYLHKLIANNVAALVDTRNNPQSMKYGFSQSRFRTCVESAGITYHHLPQLGIPSALRKNLGSRESYQTLFECYRRDVLPAQGEAIAEIKDLLARHLRVALTCFEAAPQLCHRQPLAEYITSDRSLGAKLKHL